MRCLNRANWGQRAAIAAVVISFMNLTAAKADVPNWVPEKYHKYFHKSIDNRPGWKKALDSLSLSIDDKGPAFALVAGVSKYPNMKGKAADLFPARIDVEKMVAYLEREPESFNEVVVLLDEDMTFENLHYFIGNYFPRRLSDTKQSRFLFAYSGHGMTTDKDRGYLLTSKAKNLRDQFEAGISLATLRADFQDVVDAGYQVLVLINACYGVDFQRLSLAFGEDDPPIPPTREGAHVITAGGAGELTWSDQSFGISEGKKGSIFFEAVIAALDGRADKLPQDGIVTVGELGEYLKTTVSRFTDERQNPTPGDLISTRSPGGFYFLDHNFQKQHNNATALSGNWWGGISFGGGKTDKSSDEGSIVQSRDQSECDRLAASPEDQDLPKDMIGVLFENIDVLKAIPACEAESKLEPSNPRILAQFARALEADEFSPRASESVTWYKRAAELGYTYAQWRLGEIYDSANRSGMFSPDGVKHKEGYWVPKNDKIAAKWYIKAADQGSKQAYGKLGRMHQLGRGVPKDSAKAYKYFLISAEAGSIPAQSYLGQFYEKEKNYEQAAIWHERAAQNGSALSQLTLGTFLEEGLGVDKSESQAAFWYRKSAEQGNPRAQRRLARLYELGLGVTQDNDAAVDLYRKAAAQNDDEAKEALDRIDVDRIFDSE